MEVMAARLLTIFLTAIAVAAAVPTTSYSTTESPISSTFASQVNATTAANLNPTPSDKLLDYARPFANVKDILMQEIHDLDKDAPDAKIQEEVAETLRAEAQRDRTIKTTVKPTTEKALKVEDIKKFEDMPYEDDLSDEENENDEYDENDENDENDDDLDDDEGVMMQCPDYCKCAGQYASAMSATCVKLVDGQSFAPGIAHLRIENAGQIRLGPNALRSRGLQQLETITISDTHIIELDRSAFNGLTYLFTVNLTRNGLQDIHPNTFQNNTQLGLLTIAGNPLKHMLDSKTRHYLLHASSMTELDFSNNGITKLKRTAFVKMPDLNFINLHGNKLKNIDFRLFDELDSLIDVNLSDNLLEDLPLGLFVDKYIQTLNIAGNNFTTLEDISSHEMTVLDASRNKIKAIGKEDLEGLPSLEQLHIRSNNLKRIHQHAFSKLYELTYLDISDNRLTSLTDHHFKDIAKLQILLMNDNPALQTLPIFKTYGYTYNSFSIYRFECANCGLDNLDAETFEQMPTLTRLNLAKNRLTSIPAGLLNLPSLQELDLSDNIITFLEPDMFHGAKSLDKLSLARNPLRTLQVEPFLNCPDLKKLDVSHCNLERVWSEARVPLPNLRFLSVRENLLRRITVEELQATPKLTGLDLSRNPLNCDNEFTEAVQYLTDNGIVPTETFSHVNDFEFNIENDADSKGISEWTDLAKIVCDGIDAGPPSRPIPKKSEQPKVLLGLDVPENSDSDTLRNELDKDENLLKLEIDHGMREVEDPRLLEDQEYEEDFTITEYHSWYNLRPGFKVWLVSGTVLSVLVVFLLVMRIACFLANKRGRGPVLRPPMILRQGLIDNKNCGLVYKPLHEEIATPHMPKRGSFYSSSTFHYDKIVPESV
nr:PREDICTED: LRR receptor-like serine/threonine-protein kinase GSO2 isoform X1 [Linepithema humile]XP_012215055.1 PREDICTED: LRR receptor-like serine/threonine-protein kinase GSO2 isoform X1 [Linepithema humile]